MQRGEECTSVHATSCPASPSLPPFFSILPIRIDSSLSRGPFLPEKRGRKRYVYSKKKKKRYIWCERMFRRRMTHFLEKKNVRKACLRATRKVEERRVLFPRNLESNVNRFPPRLIITPREGQRPRARHCATSRRRVVGAAQAANSF